MEADNMDIDMDIDLGDVDPEELMTTVRTRFTSIPAYSPSGLTNSSGYV